MFHWRIRESLSADERLRRSYYELLRDDLDHFVIEHALIDSYKNFIRNEKKFPFITKKELKPRAQLPKMEYDLHNSFLILFVEDIIPDTAKKHIRFFDDNKITKTTLMRSKSLPLAKGFDRTQKFLEDARFLSFLKELLPLDYALLIQRDPVSVAANHYAVTHFHVRIDWPVAAAAEDLGRFLRYISKDLYEKGDKYAESLQKKLFEYYGLPFMVGGRRTAAMVAAQFLRRLPCISTVYVASSEARLLTRISERGVSKATLVKLSKSEQAALANENALTLKEIEENYQVASVRKEGVFIFQVAYSTTDHARVPSDGKLRTLNPTPPWLTVDYQHILPISNRGKKRAYAPLPINLIYSDTKS